MGWVQEDEVVIETIVTWQQILILLINHQELKS